MRPGLPPIPPPPPRRSWLVPVTAALVALAVGVVGTLLLVRSGGPPAALVAGDPASDPAVAAAPATKAASSPPPAPTPEATGGPVDVEGVVLSLPPGWRLEADGAGTGCVTRTPGACELRVLLPDVVRQRSAAPLQDPDPDGRFGWHLGPDEPGCQAGFATSRLVVRELSPIGDRKAAYREWEVSCGGDPSRPRLWWLPETRLAFLDESNPEDAPARAAIDQIVRTADISAVAAP